MWKALGTYLVKGAIWCLGHEDEIAPVVQAIVAARSK